MRSVFSSRKEKSGRAAGNLRQTQPDLLVLQPMVVSATVRPERGSYANSLHQVHLHAISLI
jgi:hypothetical protein